MSLKPPLDIIERCERIDRGEAESLCDCGHKTCEHSVYWFKHLVYSDKYYPSAVLCNLCKCRQCLE